MRLVEVLQKSKDPFDYLEFKELEPTRNLKESQNLNRQFTWKVLRTFYDYSDKCDNVREFVFPLAHIGSHSPGLPFSLP